jgi:hypothetical protein
MLVSIRSLWLLDILPPKNEKINFVPFAAGEEISE